MPEPVSNSQRYLPGLDGLRALAVGAVVAYHIDPPRRLVEVVGAETT